MTYKEGVCMMNDYSTNNSLKLFTDFCKNSIKACDVDPAIDYLNYMIDRMEMNDEQVIWLCFLYGITYQLPTAYAIWSEYPDLELVDEERITKWFTNETRSKLPFQQDKIKCRPKMVQTILSYQQLVGKSQKEYFDNLLSSSNPQENFDKLWSPAKSIYCFGRFSTWNFCQLLKHVAGYNIEPTTLMLGESDSVSFTDGLCFAFGMPEKTTQKIIGNNGKKTKVYYKWSEEEKEDMENACSVLKQKLKLDNFQLETLACAFKKIWRTNDSRYVGYYNDRIADDIRNTAVHWEGVDWDLLWDAREACIPKEYIHDNKGVDKDKFLLPSIDKIYT